MTDEKKQPSEILEQPVKQPEMKESEMKESELDKVAGGFPPFRPRKDYNKD